MPHSEPYLSVSRRKHDGIVHWLQRAFKCCDTACGHPSVLRQMQTAGEVSKHAAWPLQKNFKSHQCMRFGVWLRPEGRGLHANLNLETTLQYWTVHCYFKTSFSIWVVLSFTFILQWTSMMALAWLVRRFVIAIVFSFKLLSDVLSTVLPLLVFHSCGNTGSRHEALCMIFVYGAISTSILELFCL